jgi:carboxylesterase type B
VTVFGESAGAGSIMHQITAFGGRSEIQFQNAVLQSPAFAPTLSNHQQEAFYNDFLRLAGVSNFAQLQALPYGRLQSANLQQIQNSSYGTFTFGPVVDGVIAPQSPGQLLAKGQFYKNVKVMTGHNSNEVSISRHQ